MAATKLLLDAMGVSSVNEVFTLEGRRKLENFAEDTEFRHDVRCSTCCGVSELSELPSPRVQDEFIRRVAGTVAYGLAGEPDRKWGEKPIRCFIYYDIVEETKQLMEELGFETFITFYNPNSKNWVYGMALLFNNPKDPTPKFKTALEVDEVGVDEVMLYEY